ncbi:dihydrofolate reductase family protein [Sinomicrobium oceani]|uniref:dihydrofolate reductase family protein n=1 Tax=Sinomicrobium oceani TaxID=1150368 RepID=UPI00227C9577|nr:dihydrofolate reductase family protein [Sinomicrobium oceani]
MKITVIANISANGRILLSDNPHYPLPPVAMDFYVNHAKQIGNLVIGLKTFEEFKNFPQKVKELFKGIEIIVLTGEERISEKFKFVGSPEEAVAYGLSKGFKEIAIGGGGGTFNSFIDQELVTDIHFNIHPLITGEGAVLGRNNRLNSKFEYKEYMVESGCVQLHLTKK